MALAFVRRQPFVASTLLGATTMEQLKTNVESLHLELSEDVLAEIEAVQHPFFDRNRQDGSVYRKELLWELAPAKR